MNKIHGKRKKNNLKVIQKQVNQSELQIWSLKNLSFPWNSTSYLQAFYFESCKQRALTMLSRLVMLKKSQRALKSWNSLQIRNL
jgi:hypothetical protein